MLPPAGTAAPPLQPDVAAALERAASQDNLPAVGAPRPSMPDTAPRRAASSSGEGLPPVGSGSSRGNLKPVREERSVVALRAGDVLVGRYRLLEQVGEGGMGAVYTAHDLELDRQVAVKLLAANLVHDEEVVERFEREAQLTAKLDHPNIVPVYDVGRHEGRPYIVMKLLGGDTLAGLLREKGGLTADETMKLMRQLALGLDYIHHKGFIHRDVKAGNIFVGPDGLATILDFGILRPKSATQGLTRTGMVMGTPHYMAPEQALGLKNLDHKVDIYALAVVLFECLTGTLPFEADSELRLIQMQAHSPPPEVLDRAPWIPRPVAAVMRRALAKRPEDRFASGAELLSALEAAYAEGKNTGAQSAPSYTGPASSPGTAPSWRAKAQSGIEPAPAVAPAPPTPAEPAVAPPGRRFRPALAAGALLVAAVVTLLVVRPWQPSGVVDPNPGVDAGAVALAPPDAGDDAARDAGVLAIDVADAGAALATAPDAGAEDVEDPEDGGVEAVAGNGVRKPKKKGKVNVITTHAGEPWWAQVSVDGVPRGRTPLLLDLPAGRYDVRVERSGFKPQVRQVKVASGKSTVLRIPLVP